MTPALSSLTQTTPYEQPGSGSFTRPDSANNVLSVRWITIEDALGPGPLRRIRADRFAQGPAMTVAQLYQAAMTFTQESSQMRSTGRLILDPARIRLWSKYGPLSREAGQWTMRDLDLDSREPLDIFVQAQGPRPSTSLGQVSENFNPGQDWGLDVSLRGVSTLMTSLQILMSEINRKNVGINSVLDALLRITRFPPALLAFTHLHAGWINDQTSMEHLHLIIDVFNILCRSMVPEWQCATETSSLEGARQVVSWIHRLASESNQDASASITCHVHRAQVLAEAASRTASLVFNNSATIDLFNGQSYIAALETPIPSSIKGLVLSAGLHHDTAKIWQYYTLPHPGWNEFMESLPLKLPSLSDFDNLLLNANASRAFRMVDPMKLGACLIADLPVVTLNDRGFVSSYDQEDAECGERQFFLWNCVTKKAVFGSQDPGQLISASLEPIITARKKERTWEMDAWTEWTEVESHGSPDESVVICVDRSYSMDDSMPPGWNPSETDSSTQPSRLHEVKDFFNHFSTRLCAYNLATHIGLVTFSVTAEVVQHLTALQTHFTKKLDQLAASGMTAVYDALSHACNMLAEQKIKFPTTKCRIILLTDGEDNSSTAASAETVCSQLFNNDIVLDVIVLGTSNTSDLFKIARATGGYAFSPPTQRVLFQLFLLETLIDIRTRPDVEKQRVLDWATFQPKQPDMQDEFLFPPCRPHPNQTDAFIDLRDARRYWARRSSSLLRDTLSANSPASTSSRASTATGERVLLAELKAMIDHEHKDVDVYVSERNIGFWKVVMEGPEASPYEGGVFLLYVDVGLDFPRVPPGVRFITPILHPNISKVRTIEKKKRGLSTQLKKISTAESVTPYLIASGLVQSASTKLSYIFTDC